MTCLFVNMFTYQSNTLTCQLHTLLFIIISVLCTLLFEIERNKTNYDLEYKFNRKKIVSFINNIYICSRYIIERITCKSLYSSIPLKISSAIRADTIEKVLHPIFD